jgi:propanol-preferring alcohol dehydrogenase
MALVTGLFKIKAESTSIPQRMGRAIAFTAEHNIQPTVQIRKLEEVGDMVAEMRAGKATTRMGVVF